MLEIPKITVFEMLSRVDRSCSFETDLEDLACELSVSYNDSIEDDEGIYKRFQTYDLGCWMCTDTHVGFMAIYFDDKPLALSFQSARKNSVQYYFVSREAALAARDVLVRPYKLDVNLISDEVMEPYYSVSYGAQLLSFDGLYENKPAKVVRIYDYSRSFPANEYRPETVQSAEKMSQITVEVDGKEIDIECSDFCIPFDIVD